MARSLLFFVFVLGLLVSVGMLSVSYVDHVSGKNQSGSSRIDNRKAVKLIGFEITDQFLQLPSQKPEFIIRLENNSLTPVELLLSLYCLNRVTGVWRFYSGANAKISGESLEYVFTADTPLEPKYCVASLIVVGGNLEQPEVAAVGLSKEFIFTTVK